MSLVHRAEKEEKKEEIDRIIEKLRWFYFLFYLLMFYFGAAFPVCICSCLISGGGGPPPPASLFPHLNLVAVVLVLDMWSVLGVTPFVSSQRVGWFVNRSSDRACFFSSLCLSPSLPGPPGQQNLREGKIP